MLKMARGRESERRPYEPLRNSRERDRSPMRDSRDLDLTSNPETVSARIFIINLTPDITRSMVEDHFSRWGHVVSVSLSKNNFGFVQFEKDNEAQACLASGYITVINGIRITVKQAKLVGSAAPPPAPPGMSRAPPHGQVGNNNHKWNPRSSYDRGRDYEPHPHPHPREDRYYDSYYRESSKEQREDESLRYSEYYRDYYDRQSGGSSNNYYRSEAEPRPPTHTYESFNYSSSYQEPIDPLDPLRLNDVEIIVPNKAQRGFAESIEGTLKRYDMLVDLLFPPPDISPSRVINDLTERHCLYAVFATPENEKHNSLTLHILHGEPQGAMAHQISRVLERYQVLMKHRNMPVDDALRLIQRNFEEYVRQTRQRNKRQIVPRDVRNLLHDLLEMRSLSMGDLDKLIKFLRERQNALVDDQIEQKREIAETQSSLTVGSLAVTYPGYNYITSTIPGTATASVAAAQPQGIITGTGAASVAQQAGPMNIVSSNPGAVAAYPATSYPGLSTASVYGGYTVAPQAQQVMQGTTPVVASATQKQSELQERILNLMKGQSGMVTNAPAPTGVPPPMQSQRIVQQQHQPAHHMWMQHARPVDNTEKINQQVYNPWSQ